MKYQNFAIIFVIIILPMAMILSYYIQMQTDTLTLQTSYQTKLNDSTYDAITAYQMNSLNTQRMAGESVKSYVLASVNTFFTTLATNFGMSSASKHNLLPYIPAILFTTYDGYYIYSPVKAPVVAEDPNTGIGLQTEEGEPLYISEAVNDVDSLINSMREEDDINEFVKNNNEFTYDPLKAKIDYNYMLKPFIYYSAQYRSENNGSKYNFVASYSLDNYMSVYGQRAETDDNKTELGDAFTNDFSKSGYLIDTSKINLKGNLLVKCVTRTAEGISTSEPSALGKNTYQAVIDANTEGSNSASANHVRYYPLNIDTTNDEIKKAYYFINYYNYEKDKSFSGYYPGRKNDGTNSLRYQTGDEIIKDTLQIEQEIDDKNKVQNYLQLGGNYEPVTVEYNGIEINDIEAKEYYIKAYFFTMWVQRNLNNVIAKNIVQDYQVTNIEDRVEYINFSDDTTKIFDFNSSDNNPESAESVFSEHKRNVIKNSIQFNLNTAISTYNANYFGEETSQEFELPIFKEQDWENILNNICMVSFMQGLPCGMTTFNNYSVVKSNNNNTSASLENLYFANEIGTKRESNYYYHKYDCAKLSEDKGINGENYSENNWYVADLSAEFKYDAKAINMRLTGTDTNAEVVCLYDDSTNKYYKIDEAKSFSGNDILAVGEEMNYYEIASYKGPTYHKVQGKWERSKDVADVNGLDLTILPNATEIIYLYDHQNLGCYDCIISGSYEPVVKYFGGELRRIFKTEEAELLIAIEGIETKYFYPDGRQYIGNPTGECIITDGEFQKRKKSVYTAIAKYRNSIYKTNDYVNR